MKKLSILLLLTSSLFAQSERANITDGGSICEDKNSNQYRSIDSLNGQVSDIAKAIDLNRRFTYMELENICHAMRTSALGIVQGKNYYEFEEIMMSYLGINPQSKSARSELKVFIDHNYKVITCPAQSIHPKGGMLVNIASSRNLAQLSTFVEQYEIDYSNIEDSEGNKIIPWLEGQVSNTSNELTRDTFRGMVNYLEGLVTDEDSFDF